MPISAKRLMEREYRRIGEWVARRDAIQCLFWQYVCGK